MGAVHEAVPPVDGRRRAMTVPMRPGGDGTIVLECRLSGPDEHLAAGVGGGGAPFG